MAIERVITPEDCQVSHAELDAARRELEELKMFERLYSKYGGSVGFPRDGQDELEAYVRSTEESVGRLFALGQVHTANLYDLAAIDTIRIDEAKYEAFVRLLDDHLHSNVELHGQAILEGPYTDDARARTWLLFLRARML